jgi:hypothetical protein
MNQRSNQPDGEPPPQKAKKKAKKSDDAPTNDDPADYRLCAVELRACARQVRGWKPRQVGFLVGALRTLLDAQDAAIGRIGFPAAVGMERLEDRLWCWTVFHTPTNSTTLRMPLGPRVDLEVEPPADQFQRVIEEHTAAFTDAQMQVLREVVDGFRNQYEAGLSRTVPSWSTEEAPMRRPRGLPNSPPPSSTEEFETARKRAEVPSGPAPAQTNAALEALRTSIFREEYDALEMIAGAFETLAECADFLAEFKPPKLNLKEEEVLLRLHAADAVSERRGIKVKVQAAKWKGALGNSEQTRERAATTAVASLNRAGLVAPRHKSEGAYLTTQGLKVARALCAARVHQ